MRIVSDSSGRRLPEPPLVDLSESLEISGRPARTIVKTTDPDKYNIKVSDYVV